MRRSYRIAALIALVNAPQALTSQQIKLAGGVAAGISAAGSDDDMIGLAGPAILIVALVGAVAGGLVGGLAWLVSH